MFSLAGVNFEDDAAMKLAEAVAQNRSLRRIALWGCHMDDGSLTVLLKGITRPPCDSYVTHLEYQKRGHHVANQHLQVVGQRAGRRRSGSLGSAACGWRAPRACRVRGCFASCNDVIIVAWATTT